MAYIINRFDGTRLVVVDDGILDNSAPLGLVGRNYTGWGEVFNENFIFLLENFRAASPPTRSLQGQAWYDSTNKVLKVYDGENWNPIGNATVSENEPSITQGGLWFKITTQQLFVNDGQTWKLIGPEGVDGFDVTRIVSTTINNLSEQPKPVAITYINGQPISIFSGEEFDISTTNPVLGFSKIYKGLNFRSDSIVFGNLKGNSETSSKFEIARKINGILFDGSQDITIKSSTTSFLKKGTYIIGSDWDGTIEDTWSVDATPDNRIGKIVARDANGDFSSNIITANLLISNVQGNISGRLGEFDNVNVSEFISGNLRGNSTSATRFQTPRKINTINFDGTQDITLPVPANTLTTDTLAGNVINSSLKNLGKLTSLSVDPAGIQIGSNNELELSVNNSIPTIKNRTTNQISNVLKLELNTGSESETPADISFISYGYGFLEGVSGPALVPNWNKGTPPSISLGTPQSRWSGVYSNLFKGQTLDVSDIRNSAGTLSINSPIIARTITASLTGNVIGNVTGNVIGNVTGSASLNALKTGDDFTGNISWSVPGVGLNWSSFTDSAHITFYTSGDTDQDTRLEFNTKNNGNEYFLFTHTYEAGNKINLFRLDPNDNFGNVRATVYGNLITFGSVTGNSFSGSGSSLTNLNATSLSTGRVPTERLSGTYNISVSGNSQTVSVLNSSQIVTALGYVPANRAGDNFNGDINWSSTARGLNWAFNTDGASIRFYNTGDGDADSRLEFETRDNGNEYFRWTHTPSGGSNFESMRLVPNSSGNSVLTVRGNINATGSISAVNLSGSGSAITNLNASNLFSGTVPVGRLSGTYNISITGNANTVSAITSGQIVSALGYVPVNPSSLQNQAGTNITGANASFTGVLNVSAGTNGGIRFPNDAFGGGGDTARITLETKGGEATTLTFRVTNDADDTIGFFAPSNDGLTMNNNIVLHAGNYNNYSPSRSGAGASGTWPINITGNSNFANTATTATNVIGGTASVSSANISGVLTVSAGAGRGIRWPNDAFGGSGDTASITLESAGGERTRMTFRITNDAGNSTVDDKFSFEGPDVNSMLMNGHVVINSANLGDYQPTRSGGGAFGTWNISITGQAGSVASISAAQISSALGYIPVSPTAFSTASSGAVQKTGDSMSGYLTLVGSPINSNHAATKSYVDSTVNAATQFSTPYYAGVTTLANVISTYRFFPNGIKVAFIDQRAQTLFGGNGSTTFFDYYRRVVRKNSDTSWSDVGG